MKTAVNVTYTKDDLLEIAKQVHKIIQELRTCGRLGGIIKSTEFLELEDKKGDSVILSHTVLKILVEDYDKKELAYYVPVRVLRGILEERLSTRYISYTGGFFSFLKQHFPEGLCTTEKEERGLKGYLKEKIHSNLLSVDYSMTEDNIECVKNIVMNTYAYGLHLDVSYTIPDKGVLLKLNKRCNVLKLKVELRNTSTALVGVISVDIPFKINYIANKEIFSIAS